MASKQFSAISQFLVPSTFLGKVTFIANLVLRQSNVVKPSDVLLKSNDGATSIVLIIVTIHGVRHNPGRRRLTKSAAWMCSRPQYCEVHSACQHD